MQTAMEKSHEQMSYGEQLTFRRNRWAEEGVKFRGLIDKAQWQIGDWLCAAAGTSELQLKTADALKHAVAITGYKRAMLYMVLQVAHAFPESKRLEFPTLSWEHFHIASSKKFFGKKALDRGGREKSLELLRDAAARNLSTDQMREGMRAPKPESPGVSVTFRILEKGMTRYAD
jgi:hypothetical protein